MRIAVLPAGFALACLCACAAAVDRAPPRPAPPDCAAACTDPQADGYARVDADRFQLRRVILRCIRAPCPTWQVLEVAGQEHRLDEVRLAPDSDETASAIWRDARDKPVRIEGAAWLAPDGARAVVRIDRATVQAGPR